MTADEAYALANSSEVAAKRKEEETKTQELEYARAMECIAHAAQNGYTVARLVWTLSYQLVDRLRGEGYRVRLDGQQYYLIAFDQKVEMRPQPQKTQPELPKPSFWSRIRKLFSKSKL